MLHERFPTLNEIRDRRIQREDTRRVLPAMSEKRVNNIELAEQLGNPVRLFYPLGRYDIDHIIMPSVSVMAIVDRVPLLFNQRIGENYYSPAIYQILTEEPGENMTLPEIFGSSLFDSNCEKSLLRDVDSSLQKQIQATDWGFIAGGEDDNITQDNFAATLSTLILMGVDLAKVKMSYVDEAFRFTFPVEEKEKTIIFKEAYIDTSFTDPTSPQYQWVKNCFDGFEDGPTAFMVRADVVNASPYLIDAVQPSVIFGTANNIAGLFEWEKDFAPYTFKPVGILPFPDRLWGYGYAHEIMIGRKITDHTS